MSAYLQDPLILDVSHHDPVPVTWINENKRVKAIISKITEGTDFFDDTCGMNLQLAQAQSCSRGVYHFMKPDDVEEQFVNFRDSCRRLGYIKNGLWQLEWPPITYAEISPKYSSDVVGAELAHQQKVWLDLVEKETGKRPLIYGSKYTLEFWCSPIYWTKVWDSTQEKYVYLWLTNSASQPPEWIHEYQLWGVHYLLDQTQKPFFLPEHLPRGWQMNQLALVQYSDQARLTGWNSAIDANYFPGTEEELQAYLESGELPEIGELPMGTIYVGSVTTDDLRIRNSAPSGTVIGYLKKNDVVKADLLKDVSGVKWWRLISLTRGGVPVELPASPERWASGSFITLTDTIIEPPNPVQTVAMTVTPEIDGISWVPVQGNPIIFKKV